ncbi:MAG TPA: transglycosylase domain-containing protein, partial [Candidatus Binataceae bacterium]|nr:transglycosylase domain-containing protein [Candidatus Binataceae bacterium]
MRLPRIIKIALLSVAMAALFCVPPALYYFGVYYNALEQEVVTRFSGKRWNIPSRIYSDSAIVYPGQNLNDLGFFDRLARLNYHRIDSGLVKTRGEYSFDSKQGELIIFLHSFAYPYGNFGGQLVDITLSADHTIESMRDPVTRKAVFSFELEPELISGIFEGSWDQRRLVRLNQIPPLLIDAILAAEDHRFYEHHGVDFVRILKAAVVDLASRRIQQGGSTLTQQLMKNFFLTNQR